MFKYLFSIILLNQLLYNILSRITVESHDNAAEDYKDSYIKEFKQKVKDNLTKRNIYQNEKKLVSKEEFIEIFRDIMSEGDEQNISEGFADTFNSLTDEFVNDAFPDGVNSIKGSEVHKYFEYENIIDKFNKYIAKISQQYNPNNRNNNDDDL